MAREEPLQLRRVVAEQDRALQIERQGRAADVVGDERNVALVGCGLQQRARHGRVAAHLHD